MCFCNRVGCCTVEPAKELEGDWGGVICSAGTMTGGEGMAKGTRVAEELDWLIEMASARDEAYEGASGGCKEDEATPRSVGASKDKRSISSSKFLRKNVSRVSWNASISGGHSWPCSRRQLSMMRTYHSSKLEIIDS